MVTKTNFRMIDGAAVHVSDFGAVGDALISRVKPLYNTINGLNDITNPNATDDTTAIDNAISAGACVEFDGSKGYLVSELFTITDSNKTLKGNGCVIVYRGGRTATAENTPYGIFSAVGVVNSSEAQATVAEDVDVFSDRVVVTTSTNTLSVGDWFLFKATNGVTNFDTDVLKYAYYPSQVVALDDVGGGKTSIQMSYKTGFAFTANQITLGKFEPVDNFKVSDFTLIDEMTATHTPDTLPVPQAPVSERAVAVGLVYARNVTNYLFDNLKSYNGLYSCVTAYTTSIGEVSNIHTFKPRWFGGGEGYSVRAVTSSYLNTRSLSMLGGRHVIDWTTCSWCNHDGSNGSTDQVSFSMHTQCEHDISISNTSGGDFYLANGAYGKVCTRITLDNCNFKFVRLNCLHLTIKNSQLNDFEATCGKLSIKNTNISDFKTLIRESRTGWEDTLSYTQYGKFTIDKDSSIKRLKDYTAGTKISSWYYIDLANRWTSEIGDSRPSLVIEDCTNIRLSGNMRETLLLLTGSCININTDSLEGKWSDNSQAQNFISLSAMNIVSPNVQQWRLTNMSVDLQSQVRPFQIVGRSDSVQAYEAVAVVGGNTFLNANNATLSDKSANNKLTLNSVSATRDAYNNSKETQVECKSDAARYNVNDVVFNKGSTGGAAVWDGSNWIDL